MKSLLELVRERGNVRGGVVTADYYAKHFAGHAEFDREIKRASDTLTFHSPGMCDSTKATSSAAMKGLLPDGVELPKHAILVSRHVLTATEEDRDLDILDASGASLDMKMPSLWQHIHSIPVGKMCGVVERSKNRIVVASALLDLNDLTNDIVKLVEADVLRWSHGFIPIEYEMREAKLIDGAVGFHIKKFEIMEESYVSVPSCRAAEMEAYATEKFSSSFMKSVQDATLKSGMANHVRGVDAEAIANDSGGACEEVQDQPAESVKSGVALDDVRDSRVGYDSDVASHEKGGRSLSSANMKIVSDVADDLEYMHGLDKMPREAKAMCKGCHDKLRMLIDAATPDEPDVEDDAKLVAFDVADADVYAFILDANDNSLRKMKAIVSEVLRMRAADQQVAEYRDAGLIVTQ
jgi:hypothetical protein